MKFDVAYRTADGKMSETTIEVSDRNAVYSELRRRGITPISLSESGAKKRSKRGARSAAVTLVEVVVLVALLAIALFVVWYYVIADEGTKRHLQNTLKPTSKIFMQESGSDSSAPRRGTGAVSVKMSE